MADPVLATAMALDSAFGWPGWLYRRVGHPVGGFARIISAGAEMLNRPQYSAWHGQSTTVVDLLFPPMLHEDLL